MYREKNKNEDIDFDYDYMNDDLSEEEVMPKSRTSKHRAKLKDLGYGLRRSLRNLDKKNNLNEDVNTLFFIIFFRSLYNII